ncbi:MAG: type II toxin-antitoxin system VapC family toxin [Microcystis sp.]|jgi:PIN domain nuclease of toxin-antitoxin system|nr:type II toxin-antitoxin system VapC family toxin [Microcystis aeruginosa LG13-12]
MRLLLDTHIFLWFLNGDTRLSQDFCDAIKDAKNSVYLSVASIWEAIIKYQLGKLPLPESPEVYLPKQRNRHQITSLTIDEESIAYLMKLPPLHRDPFDRLLICQAMQNDLIIITVDQKIRSYPIIKTL